MLRNFFILNFRSRYPYRSSLFFFHFWYFFVREELFPEALHGDYVPHSNAAFGKKNPEVRNPPVWKNFTLCRMLKCIRHNEKRTFHSLRRKQTPCPWSLSGPSRRAPPAQRTVLQTDSLPAAKRSGQFYSPRAFQSGERKLLRKGENRLKYSKNKSLNTCAAPYFQDMNKT